MEENQITKQYSTITLENLFKHNIFFTPVNEDRTSFISNDNFSINVAYVTKKILLRKQNINQLEDLLDQIDQIAKVQRKQSIGSFFTSRFFVR